MSACRRGSAEVGAPSFRRAIRATDMRGTTATRLIDLGLSPRALPTPLTAWPWARRTPCTGASECVRAVSICIRVSRAHTHALASTHAHYQTGRGTNGRTDGRTDGHRGRQQNRQKPHGYSGRRRRPSRQTYLLALLSSSLPPSPSSLPSSHPSIWRVLSEA